MNSMSWVRVYISCPKTCSHSIDASMQAMGALERTRTIALKLGMQKIAIVVRDPTSEWDLRLMAAIKSAALGAKGGLDPLPHEKWLMDFSEVKTCSVPEQILAPMKAARSCAHEILSNIEIECFADIVKAPLIMIVALVVVTLV